MASRCRLCGMLLLLGEFLLVGCRDPNPLFGAKSIHSDASPNQDEVYGDSSIHTLPVEAGSNDTAWLTADGLSFNDVILEGMTRSEVAQDALFYDTGSADRLLQLTDTALSPVDVGLDRPIDQPKPDVISVDTKAAIPDANVVIDTQVVTKDTSASIEVSKDTGSSLLNGAACTNSNQCLSGACVDGACCFSQQCGLCESCNQSGSAGICTSTCPSGQTCQIGICKPRLNFQRVSAGGFASCKLNLNNSLSCWGADTDDLGPTVLGSRYSEISVGFVHTCGLRIDGSILCWGSDSDKRASPPDQGPFTQVSAGGEHTCALRLDGSAVCWGKNHMNQVAPMPTGLFRQISAGGEHTCAMRVDGSVVCWGRNASEEESYSLISAGDFHTCGLRADGSVSCWGDNQHGQAPSTVEGTFSQVTCGGTFSCGLKTNGSVVCWGENKDKVLSSVPEGPFSQIDAGWYHVCAARADNSVTCWGKDADVKIRH